MTATAPSAGVGAAIEDDAVSANLDEDLTKPIRVLRPCAPYADVDHLSRLAALADAMPAVLGEAASPMQVMGGVEMSTELVADGPADVRAAGHQAVAAWRRAEALFGALRRLLRGGDLLRREIELDQLVAHVRERVRDNRRGIPVRCDAGVAATAMVCEPLIVHAVVELVRNAMRASAGDAVVDLDLRVDGGPDGDLVVRVTDDGPGAPALARDHAGSPLDALDAGQPGVGLIAVAMIAELHGGRLEHACAPGRGACFTLRIPRR